MGKPQVLTSSLVAFGLFLALASCDPRTEGCLDFRSSNLDVSADRECDDCCRYPSLTLRMIPQRFNGDSLVFAQAGAPSIVNGDTFRLENFGFYLHDLKLVLSTGETLDLVDTLSSRADENEPFATSEQSVLRIAPFSTSRYELGTLLSADTLVALSAKLGLPENLRTQLPAAQYRNSPLAAGDSLLFDPSLGYLAARAITTMPDSARNSFQLAAEEVRDILLDFPVNVPYQPSFELSLLIELTVDDWTQLSVSTNPADAVQGLIQDFTIIQAQLTR